MPWTDEGRRKAAITVNENYGKDFRAKIGRMGGLKGKKDGVIKGFATNRELASEAGRRGGLISRRGAAK